MQARGASTLREKQLSVQSVIAAEEMQSSQSPQLELPMYCECAGRKARVGPSAAATAVPRPVAALVVGVCGSWPGAAPPCTHIPASWIAGQEFGQPLLNAGLPSLSPVTATSLLFQRHLPCAKRLQLARYS